jgi:hypothetical protein
MENTSPFLAMQQVERQLKGLLRGVDAESLEPAEKKALSNLRRLSVDARLDIRDYELSETRDEQVKKMQAARKRLAKLQASVLSVGFVFGPADVAQLTAQLEHIQSRLL